MPASVTQSSAFVALLAASAGLARAQPEIGVNALACSLYGELAEEQENLFFSPFSLSTALAMTAEGARGETARQMGDVLGLDASMKRDDPQRPYDWSALHSSLGQLADRLAPEPAPPTLLAQLHAQRAELDRANATLERATTYDRAYFDLGEKSQKLADGINRLQRQIDPTEFRSANALWLEQSFALEPPYLEAVSRYYKTGGAMPVDFRFDPEGSRTAINDWVGERTHHRIEDLLARDMIDETTRLVLTNAVYFLGEWLEPFERTQTRTEKFTSRDGSQADVSLMRARKTDGVRYAAFNADGSAFPTPLQVAAGDTDISKHYPADGFQIVELPYRGDALSMLVILPMQAGGLPGLEAMFEAGNLQRWTAVLESRSVDVALPKFKLETSFELSQALQRLGMKRAFVDPAQAGGAQFDGISASADPAQRLYIGAVVHKALVEVDEKGTEAAAATAVAMLAGAAMPAMVDFTPVFRADRAFVFLIRDKHSGAILFLGRLARPSPR